MILPVKKSKGNIKVVKNEYKNLNRRSILEDLEGPLVNSMFQRGKLKERKTE